MTGQMSRPTLITKSRQYHEVSFFSAGIARLQSGLSTTVRNVRACVNVFSEFYEGLAARLPESALGDACSTAMSLLNRSPEGTHKAVVVQKLCYEQEPTCGHQASMANGFGCVRLQPECHSDGYGAQHDGRVSSGCCKHENDLHQKQVAVGQTSKKEVVDIHIVASQCQVGQQTQYKSVKKAGQEQQSCQAQVFHQQLADASC